ncbi:MAG: hypothetical protein A2284_12310 [Deltaproteobacteria bacterium RIFOXYA12_FULL_61_11]|nr:MAG: hypothetical protein A2284_12310 [Deltaproteobacteria bacterium RIFOXYA12_FULL_61_11]
MHRILLFLPFLCCCSPELEPGAYGKLELKLLGSAAEVHHLEVSLQGPGITDPMTAQMSLSQRQASLYFHGVPAGIDRVIEVTCRDATGQAICTLRREGVTIEAGQTTELAMVLALDSGSAELGAFDATLVFNHPPSISRVTVTPSSPDPGQEILCEIVATDEDGDALEYQWSATAGTFTQPGESTTGLTVTEPGEVTLTVLVSDGLTPVSMTLVVEVGGTAGSASGAGTYQVVLNELLADPPDDILGDANADGVRDLNADEFVELVNAGTSEVDLSGWTLADSTDPRHVFPQGTMLAPSAVLVVFGGGAPTLPIAWQVASSGGLGLNNSGDTLTLCDQSGTPVTSVTYGGEGGYNQSLSRSPDLSGEFVKHSTVSASLFSPGYRLDGSPFN